MAAADDSVPSSVRLIANPVRWRLLRELARGDQRVRELVTALGQPQNLISYHLRQLRSGGLVTARRSNFDARDTYYSLDLAGCANALAGAASALHPALAPGPAALPPGPAGLALGPAGLALGPAGLALGPAGQVPGPAGQRRPAAARGPARHVLFVCTGNSGRSPMAAALLRHGAGRPVRAASAGTHPKPLHPAAAAVLRDRYRIDISGHRPTHVNAVAGQRFDYVISLCDKAREACPEFAGSPTRVHWSLPDPGAGAPTEQAAYAGFERAAAELSTRIQFLLPVLETTGP